VQEGAHSLTPPKLNHENGTHINKKDLIDADNTIIHNVLINMYHQNNKYTTREEQRFS
jgi:hypothetical protein